jgi:hypothetical protein
MFGDLKKAWSNILYNSVFTADHYSQTVTIPIEQFEAFQKEFNICFVEPEEDSEFKSWQDGWQEE